MPKEENLGPTITGDVVALTEVTVNSKGDSTTAILKKGLRETLGKIGDRLTAAALPFSGSSVLLMSADTAGATIRVRKIGKNRYEIELTTEEDERVDETTEAFLQLKANQFKSHALSLAAPMTANQWQSRMDDELRGAKAAACKYGEGDEGKT